MLNHTLMPAKNRQVNESSPEAREPATTTGSALTLMEELLKLRVWSDGHGAFACKIKLRKDGATKKVKMKISTCSV